LRNSCAIVLLKYGQCRLKLTEPKAPKLLCVREVSEFVCACVHVDVYMFAYIYIYINIYINIIYTCMCIYMYIGLTPSRVNPSSICVCAEVHVDLYMYA